MSRAARASTNDLDGLRDERANGESICFFGGHTGRSLGPSAPSHSASVFLKFRV